MPFPVSESADRAAIASSLILQSPAGEFAEVLGDVRSLLDDDSTLLSPAMLDTFRERNKGALTAVELPEGAKSVLLTEYNEIAPDVYWCPVGGLKVEVDPAKVEVVSVEPYEAPEFEHAELAEQLQRSVNDYVAELFPTGVFGVYAPAMLDRNDTDSNGSEIAIVLNGSRFRPENFWNASWLSKWILDVKGGLLKGLIKVSVHFYEDGNVQLSTDRNIEVSVDGDLEKTAPAVIEAIRKAEDELQTSLNEAYLQLSETTFKKLRRYLPITRSKIDWSKLSTYRIGDEMAGRSK